MPSNHLPTTYQEFIHLSRYSRWLPEEKRRETWDETVARYFNFFTEHLKETVKSLTGGKGVDIVMDPVGGEVSEQALRATSFNGRHLVIGFANGEIPKISLNLTLVKVVSIVGVWWGRWTNTSPKETAEDFVELVSFVNDNKLNITPKNIYTLEETSLALDNFLNRGKYDQI